MQLEDLNVQEVEEREVYLRHIKVQSAEEEWIQRARNNFADFCAYISDGQHIPAQIHLEWIWYWLHPDYRRINISAFPESAKTTYLQYLYAYWMGKRPWDTNLVGSASLEQAKDRLAAVREIIEYNQRYKNVFPWIEIDHKRPNNSHQFSIWSKRWKKTPADQEISYSIWRNNMAKLGLANNHSLYAVGLSSRSLQGKRITGICGLDDLHDHTNSQTPDQREKVELFIKKTVLKRCTPTATVIHITNRWAEDDAFGRLAEDHRVVRRVRKRVDDDDYDDDVQDETEPVWVSIATNILDEEGNPRWPEHWTMEKIQAVRDDGEVIFLLMCMNDATAASSGQITLDMLRQPIPDDFNKMIADGKIKELVISSDFAETVNPRSDWTSYMAMAIDTAHPFNVYVLDVHRIKKKKVSDRVDELLDFADKIYDEFGILTALAFEENDSAAEVEDLLSKTNEWTIRQIPLKGRSKSERLTQAMEDQFANAATKLQTKRVYVNVNMKHYKAFCSELIGFPKAKHDEMVDNFSLPFQHKAWSERRERAGTKLVRNRVML